MHKYSKSKMSSFLSDKKLRLSGIAEITGLSLPTLYELKNGKAVPSSETLALVASALEVSPLCFFEEDLSHSLIKEPA